MAKKERVTKSYTTGKGILTGFVSIMKPSTKFNEKGVYQANIILDKEEGEALTEIIKEVQKEQFKQFGKGTKLAKIESLKPLTYVNEETGEETPDTEGRYIFKTKAVAYIEKGKPTFKPLVVNAKTETVKNVSIGEGTTARLNVSLQGYCVAGKTGVTMQLKAVQIIDLVEYSGGVTAKSAGFEVEDGFDGVGTDFDDEETLEKAEEIDPSDELVDEEEDF